MNQNTVFAVMFVLLAGCTAGETDSSFTRAAVFDGVAVSDQQRKGEFLAYEHTLVVDTSKSKLAESSKAVVDACISDRENQCTILASDLNLGDYHSGSIRMRVKPDGVKALIALASSSGDLVRQSTHIEDLASSIADIDKRLAILTTTRDKLLELEERGADNVDALIKITTELTKVQAELEQLTGRSAYQRQRVDLDILNIQFVVEARRSFWQPIDDSLSSFGQNLSEGLADTIYAIAYLFPWAILLLVVGYFLRKLWRRGKS